MEPVNTIKSKIKEAVKAVYRLEIDDVFIEHPDNESWGDYATNIALKLAPEIKQSPQEIAKKLSYELQSSDITATFQGTKVTIFEKIDSAPNGFINLELSKEWLYSVLLEVVKPDESYGTGDFSEQNPYFDKQVLFEYTDPNPFKLFHIGHLMSNCIGESLSRILEFSGAKVHRANYQGDVGMHVAKSIWGMQEKLKEEGLSLVDIEAKTLEKRVGFLGQAYALGAAAYKENEEIAEEIKSINYLVFISAQEYLEKNENWSPKVDYKQYLKDSSSLEEVKELYEKGRSWSLEYFETVYKRLGTKFDSYYFESLVGELGFTIVKEFLEKGVFEESEGAIVFRGENQGLHTRVFINSLGLPTYEAKDLGLIYKKYEDYKFDFSFVVTANEITEYFKVILKAMEQVDPELASKTKHVPHGMMRLKSGKMSSRTGDVISGTSLIDDVSDAVLGHMDPSTFKNESLMKEIADKIAVGALKYAILRRGIGRDIVFDREEATSLVGNTGPYLQYSYVRCRSVLEKSDVDLQDSFDFINIDLDEREEALLRFTYRFSEVVQKAVLDFSPNVICDYLFELSQRFNAFYASVPILSAEDVATK